MNKKKYLGFLGLGAIVALGFIGGCSNSDNKGTEPESHASFNLNKTVSGVGFCVTGDIVISGGSLTQPVTIHTDCGDGQHTVLLTPATYNVTVNNAVCSVSPANPNYTGCTFNGPPTFVVNVGETTELPLDFTYNFESQGSVEVVFGAGAVNISLGTPTSDVHPKCGGLVGVAGADGEDCANGSVCLDYNSSGPHCYTLCDFAEGGPNPCTGGDTCVPGVHAQGDTGAGGAFDDNNGEVLAGAGGHDSLSDVQGLCLPVAAAGAGGSGGAPAAGSGGVGGLAAGSGGVGGNN